MTWIPLKNRVAAIVVALGVGALPVTGWAVPGAGALFGTDAGGGNLIRVDAATGLGTVVGPLGVSGPALAIEPGTGRVFFGTGGGGAELHEVNPVTGAASFIADTGLGVAAISDLDFRADGMLFAVVNIVGDGGTGGDHLATIDTGSGMTTIIGSFGSCTGVVIPSTGGGSCDLEGMTGLAFAPDGALWGTVSERTPAGTPGLYTVDAGTGAATFVAPIAEAGGAPPQGGMGSLHFGCDGTLYGGTGQSSNGSGDGGTLGTIDPASGLFTPIGTTSDATGGNALGALAFGSTDCAITCNRPGNPFVNCSFESGDFTGWTTTDLNSPFRPLAVDIAGVSPGFGLFTSEPTDGLFAATNGFDGDGPGVIRIAQDVALPAGAHTVTFDFRAGWDLMNFCSGCMNRRFEVTIEPMGGGAALASTLLLEPLSGEFVDDTVPLTEAIDVSAFAGTSVRVSFDWTVPEPSTGPAFAQLDNVDLLVCGDGVVDPAEECDDGNLTDGDGCSAACDVEQCWTCSGSPSVCTPPTGCRTSTVPEKTLLVLTDKSNDKKDRLTWKWRKGASTDLADFGDPLMTDDYSLCIFDESSATAVLVLGAEAPAGGTCGKKDCWKARGQKGYRYKDKEATPDGLTAIKLQAGAAGKASIVASGKGGNLPLPTLPLATPLRVQLQAGSGVCWEASYTDAGVKKNDTGRFKAKGSAAP